MFVDQPRLILKCIQLFPASPPFVKQLVDYFLHHFLAFLQLLIILT